MATQEEIVGDIRQLNDEIVELEKQSKDTTDKELKLSIDTKIIAKQNSITAKENRLTALITSQQGNFLVT